MIVYKFIAIFRDLNGAFRYQFPAFLLLTAIPMVLYFVLGFRYGFASYKAWKLLFSFSPFILLGFFIDRKPMDLERSNARTRSVAYFLCGLFVASNWATWAPVISQPDQQPRLATSQELYDLNGSLKSLRLRDLNIALTPYFESMFAAAIVPSDTVHIVSPTYSPSLQSSNTCTLIRKARIGDYPKGTPTINISTDYAIVSFPNTCLVSK
jgi:hypothetical protein